MKFTEIYHKKLNNYFSSFFFAQEANVEIVNLIIITFLILCSIAIGRTMQIKGNGFKQYWQMQGSDRRVRKN